MFITYQLGFFPHNFNKSRVKVISQQNPGKKGELLSMKNLRNHTKNPKYTCFQYKNIPFCCSRVISQQNLRKKGELLSMENPRNHTKNPKYTCFQYKNIPFLCSPSSSSSSSSSFLSSPRFALAKMRPNELFVSHPLFIF